MPKRMFEDMLLQNNVNNANTDTESYRLAELGRFEVRPVRVQRLRHAFAYTCAMARPR